MEERVARGRDRRRASWQVEMALIEGHIDEPERDRRVQLVEGARTTSEIALATAGLPEVLSAGERRRRAAGPPAISHRTGLIIAAVTFVVGLLYAVVVLVR